MPHIVIEYSANLNGRVDLAALLRAVHAAALDSGVFPVGGLRTRAAERAHYLIADGHPDNAFVHAAVRIGHGRDAATKKRAGERLFAALCAELEPLYAAAPLAISLDIQEIDPALSFKRNNLHAVVERRAAGAV